MKPTYVYPIRGAHHHGHLTMIRDILRIYQPELLFVLLVGDVTKEDEERLNTVLHENNIVGPTVIVYKESVVRLNSVGKNVVMIKEYVRGQVINQVKTEGFPPYQYLFMPAPTETEYRFKIANEDEVKLESERVTDAETFSHGDNVAKIDHEIRSWMDFPIAMGITFEGLTEEEAKNLIADTVSDTYGVAIEFHDTRVEISRDAYESRYVDYPITLTSIEIEADVLFRHDEDDEDPDNDDF